MARASPRAEQRKSPGAASASKKTESSVEEVIASIDHPLKADLNVVRKAVLSVDKSISEGVKWNSLSFRTTEWFATWNWRVKDQVQLVLHLGAKTVKAADPSDIPDPKGLLDWKGQDRALANLGAGAALKATLPALKAILKVWIRSI
ncbi:MAG: DUF1801 domain-containing protein [Hyphomonadaceae bacterium]